VADEHERRSPASGPAAGDRPGPLVSVDWVREHIDDPDLHVVHVSPTRRVYSRRHLPGAVFSAVHRELGLKGRSPETGDAEREWLVPERDHVEQTLRRWGVGEGDRVVFYDDVALNRQAVRGYWLLRLYRFPADRVHVMDGGITAWTAAGHPVTADVPEPDLAHAARPAVTLGERDDSLIATYEEVLAWSREASAAGGPTRLLDVRTPGEYVGSDLRARRGGHVPGAHQRLFSDLLTDEGTFRPVEEMLTIVRSGGVDPAQVRATYCQGGVRAALAWFALHELAGLPDVKSYAGSWEEWGNREDSPIETDAG
jgi:thiosulfate/3-mercaptopyruvate sulfurtransferase